MSLALGTKLGPYEIISPLGAGGMGEVYRARDSKLKRDVALKVLPDAFAADPDRMARFQREAEVLASLNHPNIAHIYGVEERAIVMELVEGRTLQGPLPVETALLYARQIAEALEYAHERGVIHRDLKPANIKVTPEETVKLLDFGLAKAVEDPAAGGDDPSNSPTLTLGATRVGVILGTAAYMSPEQAAGKMADRRADIWSFGAVLFEMLSGKQAFRGENASDTLATVMKLDPDWNTLPKDTPASIVRLLGRCLTKDRKQRLQAIGEARIALESPPVEQEVTPPAASGSWFKLAATIAAAAIAAAAIAGLGWWRARQPAAHAMMRLDVDLGSGISLVDPTGPGDGLVLSPDGTRLVYSATIGNGLPRLFLRRMEQPNPTELPGTEGATDAFFSPDGQWIGFFTRPGKLSKISVNGGAVVPLGSFTNYGGASWGEDGTIVVSEPLGRGLLRVPSEGGPETVVVPPNKGELALVWPQILPGGRALLFRGAGGPVAPPLEIFTFADHRRKTVVPFTERARYLAVSEHEGYLLYNNEATLSATPFDLDKLETRGAAVPVLNDLAYSAQFGTGEFALSANGNLVYRKAAGESQSTIQLVDAMGKRQPLLNKPGTYTNARFSPDGTRLALVEGRPPEIWVYDPQGDRNTRLTVADGSLVQDPVWTPDGRYVVYASVTHGLYWVRADGAGQPQLLLQDGHEMEPFSFTHDGKRLAYSELNPRPQIWTVPIQQDGAGLKAGTPEAFLKDQFLDLRPAFSPDDHWLAYESSASGDVEVYVRAFSQPASGQGSLFHVSNGGLAGAFMLAWSHDGRELYYQSGDQIMAVSYTVKGDDFIPEKPRVWISKAGGTQWDLAHNGKRVAVVTPVGASERFPQDHAVVLVLNFLDYLKKQVPLH